MTPVPAPCGTSLPPCVGAPRPRDWPWTMLTISTVAGRTFAATPATSGKPAAPPCEAGAVACAPPAPACDVTAVAAAAKGPLLAVRTAVGAALVAVASAVGPPAPAPALSVRLQAARDSARTRARNSAEAGADLRKRGMVIVLSPSRK